MLPLKQTQLQQHNLQQQKTNTMQRVLRHFSVQPVTIPIRILSSLVPPLWWVNIKLRRIYMDLLTPVLMFVSLAFILQYGHETKVSRLAHISVSPLELLFAYYVTMSCLCWAFCKAAASRLSIVEIVALFGYSFGGHVITLLLSLVLFNSENDDFFYVCMCVFGGLSALRFILAVNSTIVHVKIVVRFLLATFLCTVHLLFEIFVYFSYMHQSFRFGEKRMAY